MSSRKMPEPMTSPHPDPSTPLLADLMGFRQFSLRGLDKVRGEWNLVTLAWNIKRMFTLQYA